MCQVLRSVPAAHFGRRTAEKLVAAAQSSIANGRALTGRASSLRILCDQLARAQANLKQLEEGLERLITTDPVTKGLQQMPELGLKSVAVVRAELGEVDRFTHTDQAVAYAGMDIKIKERGQWKGKAKRSKQGSGLLRQILSPFRSAQYSPGRLRLRGIVSSSGRARVEENVRHHGRHA